MKLTVKQIQDWLLAAGVPAVEIVADEKDADVDPSTTKPYTADALVQTLDAARKPVLQPQIEAAYKEEWTKQVDGKKLGSFRSNLARRFNIKQEDLKDLSEDEMINKALELHNGKFSQDTEQLRAELKKMAEDHAAALSAKDSEWEPKLKAATERYVERDIDTYLLNEVIRKSAVSKKANEMELVDLLKGKLRGKHHLIWNDETKKAELRMKDNPESPVFNETKTKQLEPMDEAESAFRPLNLWETDTRNQNPADANNQSQNNGGGNNNQSQNNGNQQNQSGNLVETLNSGMNAYLEGAGV